MNHNKNKASTQKKLTRDQLIQSAKEKWNQAATQLAQEKEDLGYKEFSWDAFLEISPDDSYETATQSKIIELQDRYKELKDQEKIIWAEDFVVKELNQKHAVIRIDQTFILTEKFNIFNNQDFSLESRQSFRTFYEDERIMCIDGIERSKADIWLKSTRRRKYLGLIFEPRTTENERGYYNLWKGFSVQSQEGDSSLYWEHVKENICNGDKEIYWYVRKWLAYVFQYPEKIHTALVLYGSQGVGKNSFVEPLGRLLGLHYAPLSNISELTSHFNYHLKNAVLIHANEALWGGNKKDIGTIKAMITEELCLIEGKGKDRIVVPNFKHVIISSNEDWPVHLDPDDRRFFVLQVGEKHKEDHEYFKAIDTQLKNGGLEALLFDLLTEDLTDFDPKKLPSNQNSFNIKLRSAESSARYLYEALKEGGFSIGDLADNEHPVWQSSIPKDSVYEDYTKWCQKSSEHILTKQIFGRAINKFIISVEEERPGGGKRQRCYKFPSLRQTQKDFSKAFKEAPERIFDNYESE